MANAYLEVAHQVLLSAGRPLRPKEILEIALHDRLMPSHVHGATQHKTLHARLSEDIRRNSTKVPFCVSNPAFFFLREEQLVTVPNAPLLWNTWRPDARVSLSVQTYFSSRSEH